MKHVQPLFYLIHVFYHADAETRLKGKYTLYHGYTFSVYFKLIHPAPDFNLPHPSDSETIV